MLGIAIAGYVNVFEPERLTIGGGLSRAGHLFLDRATQEADARALPALLRSDDDRAGAGRRERRGDRRGACSPRRRSRRRSAILPPRTRPRPKGPNDDRARSWTSSRINTIRTLSMDAVQKANSGHPGRADGARPARVPALHAGDEAQPGRTRTGSTATASCSRPGTPRCCSTRRSTCRGYGLTLEDLENFRQLGSPTAGHPERGDAAGIEATTGPLGQGISMSVGLALAEAMLAARYNRPGHELIDHRTYAIASDGDMQEGVASEACSLAGHLGLGKLTVFYDNNHIQLAGETAMAFSEDVGKRFEAYGWHVQDLGRGPRARATSRRRSTPPARSPDRPSLIMLRTHIGYGSPEQAGHQRGARLAARRGGGAAHQGGLRLGPATPTSSSRTRCSSTSRHGRRARRRGGGRVEASAPRPTRPSIPTRWDELTLVMEGGLPDGWDAELPQLPPRGRAGSRRARRRRR